jgi:uncharacterized membrane protein
LLCVLAALKPSLLVLRKIKQAAAVVFLIDTSKSMEVADEANARSRWEAARKELDAAVASVKKANPILEVRAVKFDAKVHDYKPGETTPPEGRETALGSALDESLKLLPGTRIVSLVVFSDGASNSGTPPLVVAQRLKGQQVPVIAVGFGSEDAGKASRDLSARELIAGQTVFIKNILQVQGTIGVRGYDNETLDVELYVEDGKVPVDRAKVRVKGGATVATVTGLKFKPDRVGETKLTLKVVPRDDERVKANNEISSYVTVLKGGLAVLFLQGPNFSWEPKYLTRALDAAQEIQADFRGMRRSAREDAEVLPDDLLVPLRYDVIVLSDLPANFLTEVQHEAIVRDVHAGAGLMMLGGRSSFGAGGWANTRLAPLLPIEIHPGDGQVEPERGIKVHPEAGSLDNYVLRLGPTPAESTRTWSALPPIPGANRFGPAKESAVILARGDTQEPLMVAQDVPKGRVLAFAGETWPWYRQSDDSRAAHRKFWRQAILWLAHKEDKGESQIKLSLDRRRVAVGQKLELTATARDAKNEPVSDVRFETKVELIGPQPTSENVDMFNQGAEARGNYFATGQPGEYRVTVTGKRSGQAIGSDSARFLIYQDDRELDNPAADHGLLRQIAQITGGQALPPEQLGKYLKALKGEELTDTAVQKEVRLWDNWPFLLLFTLLLTAEWWLRKRHGWV